MLEQTVEQIEMTVGPRRQWLAWNQKSEVSSSDHSVLSECLRVASNTGIRNSSELWVVHLKYINYLPELNCTTITIVAISYPNFHWWERLHKTSTMEPTIAQKNLHLAFIQLRKLDYNWLLKKLFLSKLKMIFAYNQ